MMLLGSLGLDVLGRDLGGLQSGTKIMVEPMFYLYD